MSRLIERERALVCTKGSLGECGAGNDSVKLSTNETELRTKYRRLCTLYNGVIRGLGGPHRPREEACYCWPERVGAMLGPPFARIAVEGIGHTGA